MRHEIRIPKQYWTPFPNVLFERRFATLKQKHAAAVYAILHDRAYRDPDRVVKATYTDISEWASLDWRVVKACIRELRRRHLVQKLGSRTWEIPLANLDLTKGNWTPVPRLLIQEYIPTYHNSVLLLALLRAHHFHWLDHCWIQPPKLSK
jgi:hypothetical protein